MKFEYLIEKIETEPQNSLIDSVKCLNKLGDENFEVVGIADTESSNIKLIFLKRKKE